MNNKKTTIVHVCAYYLPHIGGMERMAQKSAEGLANLGYQVLVLTSQSSGAKKDDAKKPNLKVSYLWSFEFANTPFAPALFWKLIKLPANTLIHLHLAQAYYPELVLLVSKLRRIPYIAHFHLDVEPSGFFGPLFVIYKKIFWKPVLQNAQRVIACSAEQGDVLKKKYGVSKERISIIANAVSEDYFSDRVYEIPREKLRLLYVGRVAPQKKLERLIEAATLIKIPFHLTISGDGEDLDKLKEMVRERKLENITFNGARNDLEMQAYHQKNDIFLISTDREGGTPLVVLEAMAAGLPIIGTNVTGVRDLLKGIGILVDEPYAQNFTTIIESIWQHPEQLINLSKLSVAKARQYSWRDYINKIDELYKKII